MSDASSIRKASSLATGSAGAAFYKGAIRFYSNQPWFYTGNNWAPSAEVVVTTNVSEINDAVDQNIFIAERPYQVVSVKEVHSTAGTDAGAVTLAVKKCTGTQAPSAGTNVLTGTLNLKGTANTVQSGTLSATAADSVLAAGDRLAIDITGTPTAVAGVVVLVTLRPY